MTHTPNLPPAAYRPELDGLRAIAVLGVLLYHTNNAWLPGGFVGVDIFFVISGFLITGLILRDLGSAAGFSLAGFYERRVRRIVPALLALLLAVLAAGWWFSLPFLYKTIGLSTTSAAFSYANFHFGARADYFDPSSELQPLLHTWSLAVEEQFYLVLPLLLLGVRGLSRRAQAGVLAALWLASFGASAWLAATGNSQSAFYMPHLRAWELLTGSLLAFAPAWGWGSRKALLASLAGLAGILLPFALYNNQMPFPGAAALPPVLGAAALVWAGSEGANLANRALSLAPLRWVGRISYSLYLWHLPVLLYGKALLLVPPSWWQLALLALAGIGLGWLSWAIAEEPIRRGRWLPRRWQVFTFAALGLALAGGLGYAVFATKGVPQRFDNDPLLKQLQGNQTWAFSACAVGVNRYAGVALKPCVLPRNTAPQTQPTTIIIGDSHAKALLPAFEQIAKETGQPILALTTPGCRPYGSSQMFNGSGQCSRLGADVVARVTSDPAIETVVISGFFKTDGKDNFEKGLGGLVDQLVEAGKKVVIISSVPSFNNADLQGSIYLAQLTGRQLGWLERAAAKQYDAWMQVERQSVEEMRERHRGKVKYVDLANLFCDEAGCHFITAGRVLYSDFHHLSAAGARKTTQRIGRQVFDLQP